MINSSKSCDFNLSDRIIWIEKVCDHQHFNNVKVDSYQGLCVDYAKSNQIKYLIRGVRDFIDFSYEHRIHKINYRLDPSIQTIYLPSTNHLSDICSSSVKELLRFGKSIDGYVNECINDDIINKFLDIYPQQNINSHNH